MAVSLQQPFDVADDYHALAFIIQQLLTRVATVTLVKVVACTNNGGLAPFGFVDVIPLVNQVTGDRQSVPHGTLYRLPYARLQGGANAVILDPQADDIGLALFCSRDISAVKADPAAAVANANAGKGGAPPGSARMYDMADGLYIGGLLNGTPEQYVQFNAAGVTIVSPTEITLQAPVIRALGEFQQSNGDASFAQSVDVGDSLTAQTEVTAGNIGLTTHKHPTAAPGPASPPIP